MQSKPERKINHKEFLQAASSYSFVSSAHEERRSQIQCQKDIHHDSRKGVRKDNYAASSARQIKLRVITQSDFRYVLQISKIYVKGCKL